MSQLVTVTDRGLYCERGDFYIDPWLPVARAIITHAHGDHACRGSGRYLTTDRGLGVLASRLDPDAVIDTVPYGDSMTIGDAAVSLHPAGHILGSAQVRIELHGEVWVISGDYKVAPDPTCDPFAPLACDTFVTECTFGLPIYQWPSAADVFEEINNWWRSNRDEGRASVIFAYSLGKAQRVLAGLDATIGPIMCHGAVQRVNAEYRQAGVCLPETEHAGLGVDKRDWSGAIMIAPPSAKASPWMRKFGDVSTAFVSGWMQVRGARRRRSVDRGFVISDHTDWPGLLDTIQATGARRILATHGRTGPLVRWLRESGYEADTLKTEYVGEHDDAEIDRADEQEPEA